MTCFSSLVPLAEKRLMDVKLGQLPSWFGTRDFTPNGIFGSVRRGMALNVGVDRFRDLLMINDV